MKAEWTEGFIQDFSNSDKTIQHEVKDKIEKLEQQGTNIEEVSLDSNQGKQIEC